MGERLPHDCPILAQELGTADTVLDYQAEIRKVIYTTNAIESVNMGLRKITKSRGSFPGDEALLQLFYLALHNISRKWKMPKLP